MGTAECAERFRRLPKGWLACRIYPSFLICIHQPLHSSTPSLSQTDISEIGSRSPMNPHPLVPSPGPAQSAGLRPQFAFEAPKCDFFAFFNPSHFSLAFLIEKMTKIMDFGLPKPSQNPSKMPPKSHFQKTCDFSSIFSHIFSFF